MVRDGELNGHPFSGHANIARRPGEATGKLVWFATGGTVSATLRVSRDTFGIELRRGVFEVSVDGKDASSIKPGQTIELPLEPGRHTLRIRAGRYSSHEESFDLADEQAIDFSCSGAIFWPRWVLSFFQPDLGILLKRGDPQG